MFSLKQDLETGDFVTKAASSGSGFDLDLVEGFDNEVQSIRNHLMTKLSEDSLHLTMGLAYNDMIGRFNADAIEAAIRSALLEKSNIISVSKFEIDVNKETRVATVSFSVQIADQPEIRIEQKVSL